VLAIDKSPLPVAAQMPRMICNVRRRKNRSCGRVFTVAVLRADSSENGLDETPCTSAVSNMVYASCSAAVSWDLVVVTSAFAGLEFV
jgi:hypothetical protein